MTTVLTLLLLHGVIGGLDVVWNHELIEHLPARVEARQEELLHAMREILFALIFAGLAWFEWHGMLMWIIAAALAAEFGVTMRDTLLEDKIRRLTAAERTMHVILLINFGAYTALLMPEFIHWHRLPTMLQRVDHGWRGLALSLLAIIALSWSVRDFAAFARLQKAAKMH